jgi:hypothetical protein
MKKYYSVVVFDKKSNSLLSELVLNTISKRDFKSLEWKFLDEMCLIISDEKLENDNLYDKEVYFTVTSVDWNTKVIAVKIDGVDPLFDRKITKFNPVVPIAISKINSGKSKDANLLKEWNRLKKRFRIKGKILFKEVTENE